MDLDILQTGPLKVNTFIVPLVGNAVFLVDPAASNLTDDETVISDYLTEQDLVPVGIVLTHAHFDHVMNIPFLKTVYPDLCVAVHEKDKNYLGPSCAVEHQQVLGENVSDEVLNELARLPNPDKLLEDGNTLDKIFELENVVSAFSGNTTAPDFEAIAHALSSWKVIHTPGHTPGSICLYNENEKVLISGDTVFYQSYGRTDLPGGSSSDMVKSLSNLKDTLPPETLVYPGHDTYGFTLGEN